MLTGYCGCVGVCRGGGAQEVDKPLFHNMQDVFYLNL